MSLAALDAQLSDADAKPQRQPVAIAVFSSTALRELLREMRRDDEREREEMRALAALDDRLDREAFAESEAAAETESAS
jgi:hypothetical protein